METITHRRERQSFFMRLPLFGALVLAGCGGGGGSTASDVTVVTAGLAAVPKISSGIVSSLPAVVANPTPTPTPTPAASSWAAPSLSGIDAIASGLKVSDYLTPMSGTGAIPASMAPDVVGAFRFLCAPSHNAYDDPIVYPGQPGKSPHLHTFFGNTKADGNSTYASLRTSGESTCNNLLNRSAYWIPSMMNGRGQVVMPDYLSVYYKRRPSSDPACQKIGKACIAMPRGLRYVFGYNMSDPSKSAPAVMQWWNCDGAGAVSGHFANIAQAAKGCPVGARIGTVIMAPSCWNGTDLDSADHRSHMAYMFYGEDGQQHCPATHPYIIPELTLGTWYTTDGTLDRSGDESANAQTWYLSSDRMAGMTAATPGTTMHSDWFGAWEDSIMALWTANCIEKLLSCSSGDLGNGQQIKALAGYSYANKTVLVDVPARTN